MLSELVALLTARRGHRAAVAAGERIRDSRDVTLLHPDERLFTRAWRRLVDRPDKTYSLTDCLSFVVMEESGIRVAITDDRHFRQEGFTVLPEGP